MSKRTQMKDTVCGMMVGTELGSLPPQSQLVTAMRRGMRCKCIMRQNHAASNETVLVSLLDEDGVATL